MEILSKERLRAHGLRSCILNCYLHWTVQLYCYEWRLACRGLSSCIAHSIPCLLQQSSYNAYIMAGLGIGGGGGSLSLTTTATNTTPMAVNGCGNGDLSVSGTKSQATSTTQVGGAGAAGAGGAGGPETATTATATSATTSTGTATTASATTMTTLSGFAMLGLAGKKYPHPFHTHTHQHQHQHQHSHHAQQQHHQHRHSLTTRHRVLRTRTRSSGGAQNIWDEQMMEVSGREVGSWVGTVCMLTIFACPVPAVFIYRIHFNHRANCVPVSEIQLQMQFISILFRILVPLSLCLAQMMINSHHGSTAGN